MTSFHSPASVWRTIRAAWNDTTAKIALAAASLCIHAIPFFLYGAHPLGYDTGFYRRYLIQPMLSFPNAPVPGLGDDAFVLRIILDALRATGLPPDMVLYGVYLACFAFIPVLFFVLLKPHLGRNGACIAGALIVFSAVAYNAYWFMLLKNAWALCLLLLALICFERRQAVPLFLLDIAIAGSHKTTAIVYVLTLAALFCISPGRRRELFFHGALAGAVLLALNIPSVREALVVLPSATFLGWPEYLSLAIPLLVLTVFALPALKQRPLPRTLAAFALVSALFPILGLPFYERMFVFTDVALAGIAAYGALYLVTVVQNSASYIARYGALAVLCVVTGFTFGNLWNQIGVLRPLVSHADIERIIAVGNIVPKNGTLLTTSTEAPWYEGFTLAHIAAPGLLRDTHNQEAWTRIWQSASEAERISFLASFPAPLYISTLGPYENLIGTPPVCLSEMAAHVLRDDCH